MTTRLLLLAALLAFGPFVQPGVSGIFRHPRPRTRVASRPQTIQKAKRIKGTHKKYKAPKHR